MADSSLSRLSSVKSRKSCSPTTRNRMLARAVRIQYNAMLKIQRYARGAHVSTHPSCVETRIPAGWLARCCVRRWSAGIEKGGAGEGQVRAAPRSIVLSRGGAPGPVARRDETRRPAAAASAAREPVSMGMHPLPGAVAGAFPGLPPPPPSLSATLLPREVRKPRGRNGGAPFSRGERDRRLTVCNGRATRANIVHRASRICSEVHARTRGRGRRTFDAAGASDPFLRRSLCCERPAPLGPREHQENAASCRIPIETVYRNTDIQILIGTSILNFLFNFNIR